MNVAFGGSLHPEVRDLPGRMNHRAPRAEDGSLHRDPKVVFADRHDVRFVADSVFARLASVAKLVDEVLAEAGHIDLLVNASSVTSQDSMVTPSDLSASARRLLPNTRKPAFCRALAVACPMP